MMFNAVRMTRNVCNVNVSSFVKYNERKSPSRFRVHSAKDECLKVARPSEVGFRWITYVKALQEVISEPGFFRLNLLIILDVVEISRVFFGEP